MDIIKMEVVEARIREWGSSFGIVIPKEVVLHQHLKEGDVVGMFFFKKKNIIDKMFGKVKMKNSTEQILKEIDEEGWNV